jgi:hypothetical protein
MLSNSNVENIGVTIMFIWIGMQIYSSNTGIWQRVHHVVLTIWCVDDMQYRKFVEQPPM